MELNKSQSTVWGSLQIHLMRYQFCIIDFQDLRMVKTDYHILFLLTIIDIYIYISHGVQITSLLLKKKSF